MTIPGVGGSAPMPPGYVPPGLPDTAAGSSNVFRGRLVIVFGPAGTVSGIFVYQQGTTPGPGNPPIVAITNSTVDPFGNTVQPTVQITGTGTLQVGTAPNAQVQLRTAGGVSGVIEFLLNNATFGDGLLVGGIVGGAFASINLQGPQTTVANFRDRCRLQLNSSDAVSSFANATFTYSDDAASDHAYMFVDGGGVAITACQQLKATQPGTGTSALNPAVGESWHDLRPLSNSFVGTIAGRYPPQYRKTSEGDVEVIGYVQLPATYNGVTFANLPAGYRPLSNSGLKGDCWCETNPTSNLGSPNVQADTSGNLQLHNLGTGLSGTIVGIAMRFPLDNTGLILS
jgi:hypothetical protein